MPTPRAMFRILSVTCLLTRKAWRLMNEKTFLNEQRNRDAAAKKRANTSESAPRVNKIYYSKRYSVGLAIRPHASLVQ